MRIGDRLQLRPTLISFHGGCVDKKAQTLSCRVVYIHPEERFYTVEFTFDRGERFCECYPMEKHDRRKNK